MLRDFYDSLLKFSQSTPIRKAKPNSALDRKGPLRPRRSLAHSVDGAGDVIEKIAPLLGIEKRAADPAIPFQVPLDSDRPRLTARSPSSRATPIERAQSLVDARDSNFQSAPCFCQFIKMARLVELFLPSATA